MSEQNQEAQEQPVFQIQRVYLKDLSLEQPNSPAIFLEQEARRSKCRWTSAPSAG
jgi:preprotein translocase subunit SecB